MTVVLYESSASRRYKGIRDNMAGQKYRLRVDLNPLKKQFT